MTLFVLQYEILLCVQDQEDPAVDVCKKLLAKYPNVDARLFVGKKRLVWFWFFSVMLLRFWASVSVCSSLCGRGEESWNQPQDQQPDAWL